MGILQVMAAASAFSKSIDCARPAIQRALSFMNLLSKQTFLPFAAVLTALVLSGCRSPKEPGPVLTDNPNPPSMNGTPTNDVPTAVNSALFQAGETVMVSTATGSDEVPGPIPASGQAYLIAEDGTITLPLIGPVQAAGKTPGELQEDIDKLYVPQYFIRLTVTVTAQNRVYYVGGEVAHPGAEVYIGETTVTRAIQAAGDLTQFASHNVWLTRTDGTRIRVNVDNALRDPSQDPPVFPGDQIQVPRRYF